MYKVLKTWCKKWNIKYNISLILCFLHFEMRFWIHSLNKIKYTIKINFIYLLLLFKYWNLLFLLIAEICRKGYRLVTQAGNYVEVLGRIYFTLGNLSHFSSGLHMIRWHPSTFWKVNGFTQSPDLNVKCIWKYFYSNT